MFHPNNINKIKLTIGSIFLLSLCHEGESCGGFRCSDGQCIEEDFLCDGRPTCIDSSDETAQVCSQRPCREDPVLDALGVTMFRCDYGACIVSAKVCDGPLDCVDGSDESPTRCPKVKCSSSMFTCSNGQCISINTVCDGTSHCYDSSDETAQACQKHALRLRRRCFSFRKPVLTCSYGACLFRGGECDGRQDCLDGSDERTELCGAPETPLSAPVIKVTREVVTVNEGEPVELTCSAVGNPQPSLSWQRAGVTAEHVSTDGGSRAVLRIPSVSKSDEGQYTCGAVNSGGNSSVTVTLHVNDGTGPLPVVITHSPPTCSEGTCPCPHDQHICLPCEEFRNLPNTCDLLKAESSSCSMSTMSFEATLEIISCGLERSVDFSFFSRNKEEPCVDDHSRVPPLTVVYADCWGVTTGTYRCHPDGFWRPFGASNTGVKSIDGAMRNICQPYFLNSGLCGRKSRFRKQAGYIIHQGNFFNSRNLWPFVVGVKWRQVVECSGTIISPLFVVTAGHCVVSSQETFNDTIPPVELLIQQDNNTRHDLYVSQVILHPNYVQGLRPGNDIALLKLRRPIVFSERFYPACVTSEEDLTSVSPAAVAFNRPADLPRNGYKYNEVLQNIDGRCQNHGHRCPAVEINTTQFCGNPLNSENNLRKGDSGGPFLQDLRKEWSRERWSLSGIVSARILVSLCQNPHTIFARVSAFKEWLTHEVHKDLD